MLLLFIVLLGCTQEPQPVRRDASRSPAAKSPAEPSVESPAVEPPAPQAPAAGSAAAQSNGARTTLDVQAIAEDLGLPPAPALPEPALQKLLALVKLHIDATVPEIVELQAQQRPLAPAQEEKLASQQLAAARSAAFADAFRADGYLLVPEGPAPGGRAWMDVLTRYQRKRPTLTFHWIGGGPIAVGDARLNPVVPLDLDLVPGLRVLHQAKERRSALLPAELVERFNALEDRVRRHLLARVAAKRGSAAAEAVDVAGALGPLGVFPPGVRVDAATALARLD